MKRGSVDGWALIPWGPTEYEDLAVVTCNMTTIYKLKIKN